MAITEAGRAAKKAAYEYELILSSQLPELITELVEREGWRNATTVSATRELTGKFLADKADGYRLGTEFINEVAQLASRSKH